MKKVIVFAFLPWLFSAFGYKALAQEDNLKKEEKKETQEIIIRKKGDKDANIRVEITGDKVLINGKPLVEFNDDNITVNKRKIIINDGNRIMFGDGMDELKVLGDMGNFSWIDDEKAGGAFLGVTTEKTSEGAKIESVSEESAAAKAGLKEGDIITKLGDTKIDGPESLYKAVSAKKPTDEVKVYYLRDGKEKSVKATLQERKNTARAFAFTTPDGSYKRFSMPEVRGFGNTAPHLYNEDRYNDLFNSFPRQQKLGLKVQDTEDGNGVKVLEVEENSASASAGLQKEDIVTEIGGIKVTNTDEVREQLMDNHDKNTYNIKARRNGKEMSFDIKIPKKLKTVNL